MYFTNHIIPFIIFIMGVVSFDSMFNFISPVVGVKWESCRGFSLNGEYKGIFNEKTRIQQIEGRIEWIY